MFEEVDDLPRQGRPRRHPGDFHSLPPLLEHEPGGQIGIDAGECPSVVHLPARTQQREAQLLNDQQNSSPVGCMEQVVDGQSQDPRPGKAQNVLQVEQAVSQQYAPSMVAKHRAQGSVLAGISRPFVPFVRVKRRLVGLSQVVPLDQKEL